MHSPAFYYQITASVLSLESLTNQTSVKSEL